MVEEFKQNKWEGKATVEVRGTKEEIVWQVLLEDFCNLHKWLSIDTCYKLEGIEGQPGLTRYIASTKRGVAKDAESSVMWFKEKLLKIDHIQRCFTYEIVDNNMGFKNYVATMKVLPLEINGGDDNDAKHIGCMIEWEYVCDLMEGRTLQFWNSYVEDSLRSMAKRIQRAYSSPSQSYQANPNIRPKSLL